MEHITFEKIYAYMEGQIEGAEAGEVCGHLVFCERCNKLYAGLKDVGDILEKCFKIKAGKDCPEDWEIAAFIRHETDPVQSEKIRGHINICDKCLSGAAMYYNVDSTETLAIKTPDGWIERAIHILTGAKTSQREEKTFLKRIFNSFKSFVSNLPPLPGYAVAAASIALLIWSILSEPVKIINVPSSQRIIYKNVDSLSSFAFMEGEEKKQFEGMEVKKVGSNLVFSWTPIKGAKVKEFILQKKGLEKGVTIATIPVEKEVVTIPFEKIQYNERYEWTIAGVTEDVRRFEAVSEFVVTR